IPVDLPATQACKHIKGDVENVLLCSEDSSKRGGIISRFKGTMIKLQTAFQNSFTR
ncbi:hypothetical protein MKW94_003680, partial [Papaver nudicaule]|nr:hypothetical protein [Papaver nudicaule]